MVDNSGSSKAQMPSLSQEGSLGVGYPQGTSAGVKLEAVMEQLQRQQQARLEMEHRERRLREAHILYAQQVAAQQAVLAAARTSGAGLLGKRGPATAERLAEFSNQSSVDSEHEGEEGRGRVSDREEEEEEEEMMEDSSEEDEGGEDGALEYLRKQTLTLQQSESRLPPRPYQSYVTSPSAPSPQRAPSLPIRVKQEPDDGSLSPVDPLLSTSPNGHADWGYDDQFKQACSSV